jgi:hypothetical protein
MIEDITDSDQFVYHYTSYRTAKDHILKNLNIRLGNFQNTNDLKETKNWEFSCGSNGGLNFDDYDTSSISRWMSKTLKEGTRVACFCRDSALTGNHIQDIYNRGFAKPKMWYSYGDNYSGVCLVFNKQRLEEAIEKQLSAKQWTISENVKYKNRSVIPNLYDPDDQQYTINLDLWAEKGKKVYAGIHVANHYKRLFFEKMEDWSNETEWRVISFCSPKNQIYLDIREALVGVIFGDKVSSSNIRTLKKETEQLNLEYMSLKWKNCVPWYDYGGVAHLDWGYKEPKSQIHKIKHFLLSLLTRKSR